MGCSHAAILLSYSCSGFPFDAVQADHKISKVTICNQWSIVTQLIVKQVSIDNAVNRQMRRA